MNPVLEIIRLEENERCGTFGVLKINKEVFCFTLEPPDRFNQKNISSIPAQQYRCVKHTSPKHGPVYLITNVPGRSFILFHKGNYQNHTMGCILLGSTLMKLRGEVLRRGIGNSGKTFATFLARLSPYDQFHLTISNHL